MTRSLRAVRAATAIAIIGLAGAAMAQQPPTGSQVKPKPKPQPQTAAPASSPQPLTLLGLRIPEKVAGLAHGEPHNFEKASPGLGYSIEFMRPGWRKFVYIYDKKMKSIPDDPASDVLKKHFVEAIDEIFGMEKRGTYAKVSMKGEYNIDRSGRTRFVCSAFSYVHTQSAMALDSYLCLTSWKNKFFKIRMTTPQKGDSRSEADKFAEAWIGVLWPS